MSSYENDIVKFKRALEENPKNAEVWCSWGVALVELGRVDEAVEKFAKAAAFGPHLAAAWYGWGLALMQTGQREAGIEMIKKGMELDPDSDTDSSAPV